MNRRTIAFVLLALCLLATMLTSAVPIAAQTSPFAWEMEPRYEGSWTAWNEETQWYASTYVYPQGWWLQFDACDSSLGSPQEIDSYRWHIEGLDGITEGNGTPFDFEVSLPDCRYERDNTPIGSRGPLFPQQGDYRVTLTVTSVSGEEFAAWETITVKDLLIVSIGDSSAAGEGNPKESAITADRWWDDACHRSHISGHALAAQEIEERDPHTSVTFLGFACSGAAIMKGFILDYDGIDDPVDGFLLTPRAQLHSIMRQLCNSSEWADPDYEYCVETPREIDALFVTVGVNDMGFEPLLASCANFRRIEDIETSEFILPGIWSVLGDLPSTSWEDLKDDDWWSSLASQSLDEGLGTLDEILSYALPWLTSWIGDWDYFECTEELDDVYEAKLSTLWGHFDLLGDILAGDVATVVEDIEAGHKYRWMPGDIENEILEVYGRMPQKMQQAVTPKEVYITDYPVDLFQSGPSSRAGCGPFSAITSEEAQWLYERGLELNTLIRLNATKLRWYFVGGLTEAFDGHSYCADVDDTYFVGLVESLHRQLDIYGTVHPNPAGQAVIGEHLVAEFENPFKTDFSDKYLVRVEFQSARVTDNRPQPDSEVKLRLYARDRWFHNEPLLVKDLQMAVGDDVSLAGYSYFAYLNQFDYFQVMADTKLSDEVQWIPKCQPADSPAGCIDVNPGPELGFGDSYRYEPDNDFTNSEWCVVTERRLGRSLMECKRSSSQGDGSIEVSYLITVYRLAYANISPAADWRYCADHCLGESDVEVAYRDLFAYQETSESPSTAVSDFMTLVTPDRLLSGRLRGLSGAENDWAQDMVIQPDGRMLVAGDMETGTLFNQQVAVMRLNANGTLDETFNEDGKVIVGLTGEDYARSIAQTPSGKIVVAGYLKSDLDNTYDLLVWRLNDDGTLDQSFNNSGLQIVDNGGADYGHSVLVQPDGKIVVAGFTVSGSNRWVTLVRLNPDGTLDTSFAGDGRSSVNLGSGWLGVRDALLQPDGTIVVAGGHAGNAFVLRYLANGSLDPAFSGDGIYELDMMANDTAQAVGVLPNGLLALGAYSGGDFAIFFLDDDGTPCTTFCGLQAVTPWLTVDFGDDDIVYDLAVQPDGKVLLVGARRGDSPSTSQIHLARYRFLFGRGYSLDSGFGEGGTRSLSITGRDLGRAVALDPNFNIVVAGHGHLDGQDDFLLWRLPNNVTPPAINPTLEQDGDQATLSWTPNNFYEEGYIVWRGEDPSFALGGIGAERVAEGDISSYEIPPEDASLPYYYAVGGLDSANHHTWSTEIFNLGVGAPPPPTRPTVKLDIPNGGEILDDSLVTVSWTAKDEDGDRLWFHIQYSRDNGLTWELVARDLPGNSTALDSNLLGSSQNALLRIWATDGTNTAHDQSDAPFIVPSREVYLPVVFE